MGFGAWLLSKLAVGGATVASPQQRNPQTKAQPAPPSPAMAAAPPPAPAPAPGVTPMPGTPLPISGLSDLARSLLNAAGVPYAVAGVGGLPPQRLSPSWRIAAAPPMGAGSVSVSQ